MGFLIFKKHWLGLHPPKHLYHFTPETLTNLLKSNGFKIEKIDHWFWKHSYYSYFESFRYMISPRFKSKSFESVYEIKEETKNIRLSNKILNVIKKLGILFGIILAATLTILGSFIRKGEVITVYAKKN